MRRSQRAEIFYRTGERVDNKLYIIAKYESEGCGKCRTGAQKRQQVGIQGLKLFMYKYK